MNFWLKLCNLPKVTAVPSPRKSSSATRTYIDRLTDNNVVLGHVLNLGDYDFDLSVIEVESRTEEDCPML